MLVLEVIEHPLGQVVLVEEAELVLDHVNVTVGVGLLDLGQAEVGNADRPQLALLAQPLQLTDRLGLGCVVVGEVDVVDVEVVEAEPLEAIFDLLAEEGRVVIRLPRKLKS